MANYYEKTGDFEHVFSQRIETEETAIQDFIVAYYDISREIQDYEFILQIYKGGMEKWGYTEEDFEEFFIEYIGQEEWDDL